MAEIKTTSQTTTDELLKAMIPETPAPVLKRVYRNDAQKLDATYYTEEGYLIDNPIVTTCGIFEYINTDGTIRRELRLPDEVFSEESLASYVGKPIIITHDAGAIDKDNVENEIIGTILTKGEKDGDNVRAKIVIHDTDAMRESGLKELSLGYTLELDETPGVWEGNPYDAIQRNIRINHLALVQTARAGENARLNIDGQDTQKIYEGGSEMDEKEKEVETTETETETTETETAPTETETEKTLEEIVEEIKGHQDRADEGATEGDIIKEQHDDIDALLKLIEKLKAEKDFAEAQTDDDDTEKETEETDGCDTHTDDDEGQSESLNLDSAQLEKMFAEKLDVVRTADRLHLDGVETMSTLDGKKAIVRKVLPHMNLDGKSPVYVGALYDCAKKQMDERKSTDSQRKQMFNKDSAKPAPTTPASVDARARMIARQEHKPEAKNEN